MENNLLPCQPLKPVETEIDRLALACANAIYQGDAAKLSEIFQQGLPLEQVEKFQFHAEDSQAPAEHGLAALAIRRNQADCLAVLLDNGLSPDHVYSWYMVDLFILEIAIMYESWECFVLLLDRGADPDISSSDSKGAFMQALATRDKRFLNRLRQSNSRVDEHARRLVAFGRVAEIRSLLEAGYSRFKIFRYNLFKRNKEITKELSSSFPLGINPLWVAVLVVGVSAGLIYWFTR
ncbi:MAG: hypothetical protein Q4D73_02490 [Actinomycetaceae bacterium]|nr:hypothetical protein [Actinomycetaceae bacterium]